MRTKHPCGAAAAVIQHSMPLLYMNTNKLCTDTIHPHTEVGAPDITRRTRVAALEPKLADRKAPATHMSVCVRKRGCLNGEQVHVTSWNKPSNARLFPIRLHSMIESKFGFTSCGADCSMMQPCVLKKFSIDLESCGVRQQHDAACVSTKGIQSQNHVKQSTGVRGGGVCRGSGPNVAAGLIGAASGSERVGSDRGGRLGPIGAARGSDWGRDWVGRIFLNSRRPHTLTLRSICQHLQPASCHAP